MSESPTAIAIWRIREEIEAPLKAELATTKAELARLKEELAMAQHEMAKVKMAYGLSLIVHSCKTKLCTEQQYMDDAVRVLQNNQRLQQENDLLKAHHG